MAFDAICTYGHIRVKHTCLSHGVRLVTLAAWRDAVLTLAAWCDAVVTSAAWYDPVGR